MRVEARRRKTVPRLSPLVLPIPASAAIAANPVRPTSNFRRKILPCQHSTAPRGMADDRTRRAGEAFPSLSEVKRAHNNQSLTLRAELQPQYR